MSFNLTIEVAAAIAVLAAAPVAAPITVRSLSFAAIVPHAKAGGYAGNFGGLS